MEIRQQQKPFDSYLHPFQVSHIVVVPQVRWFQVETYGDLQIPAPRYMNG